MYHIMACSISITNIFALEAYIFFTCADKQLIREVNYMYVSHDFLCVFRSINQILNNLFKHLLDRLQMTQLNFIYINIYLYILTFGTFILFQSSILFSSLCQCDTMRYIV